MDTVIGLDIGGSTILAVLASLDGEIVAHASVEAPSARGGSAVLERAAGVVADLEAVHGGVDRIGVGAAGVIEPGSGVITAASSVFVDWVGRDIGAELAVLTGRDVRVENDVNAFLHGECRWGALAGVDDCLGVMLGTGVGGALMIGGQLFQGPNGGAAEIGHTPRYSSHRCTCGRTGHLETVASGRSLGIRYSERANCDPISGASVAALARQHDPLAIAVIEEAATALGNALLSAASLFDVRDVVIGGGVSESWDLLWPRLSQTIEDDPPVSGDPLRVAKAALLNPALGAASLVVT